MLEVCADEGVGWAEIDIDAAGDPRVDAALRARLSDLVPVVEVDGVQVGYWRIKEVERASWRSRSAGDNRPMPTVHLVRHGQVHNPDKVLYGRLPQFRLSEAGEQMAQAVADYLVAEKTSASSE